MVQHSADDIPEDSGGSDEPESRGSDDSSDFPEKENESMPNDDLNAPITFEGLGLPKDYDHERDSKYIPSTTDLQRAAINALHRETAFVVYHQNQPARIVERLEELAEVARVAANVKGDHQAKAIRLGLALKVEYWWGCNKLSKWKDLVAPMLIKALELRNYELESEIYRAWATYLYITARDDIEAARNAIVAAEDYAHDSGRADLQLLMRAERFNIDVGPMSLDQARAQAAGILAEARGMGFHFVRARVYDSLVRAARKVDLGVDVFNYAQQALVIYAHEEEYGLVAPCISAMFYSVHRSHDGTGDYGEQLLVFLDALAQRSVSPYIQAGFYYAHALRRFQFGEYDSAREYTLKAWLKYRMIGFRPSLVRVRHMLGLIETKRHEWRSAERHLTACRDYYDQTGDSVYAVHVRHALAFLVYEQGDFPRALAQLEAALCDAQRLEEPGSRKALSDLITSDIDDARQRIAGDVPA